MDPTIMIIGIIVLIAAMIFMVIRPQVPVPEQAFGLQAAPPDVRRWADEAQRWAKLYGVPWRLVLAQIWQESGGDPNAVGSAGEVGLMQLKQIAVDDLRQFGYSVPDDWHSNPASNIATGVAYLSLQHQRTGRLVDALGNTKADALEAYNEGYAGATKDVEVDEYTTKVLQKAKRLGYNG